MENNLERQRRLQCEELRAQLKEAERLLSLQHHISCGRGLVVRRSIKSPGEWELWEERDGGAVLLNLYRDELRAALQSAADRIRWHKEAGSGA